MATYFAVSFLCAFLGWIIAILYFAVKGIIYFIRWLYDKLHEKKCIPETKPPDVYRVIRVYPEYEETFDNFGDAFKKAMDIYINDAKKRNFVEIVKNDDDTLGWIEFAENTKDEIYLSLLPFCPTRKLTPEQLAAFDKD